MKERPILFSSPMVRALLAGTKTQTRRVMSEKTVAWLGSDAGGMDSAEEHCPYGVPGDRLWVRETWRVFGGPEYEYQRDPRSVQFRADGAAFEQKEWKPSIFMPRWASRITLEVTEVHVQRVQDISEVDATSEGVEPHLTQEAWSCMRSDGAAFDCFVEPDTDARKGLVAVVHQPPQQLTSARDEFARLWDSINEKRGHGWATNPFVWCVSFKLVTP